MKYGRAAVYRSNIVEVAHPLLRRLRDVTGHTAVQTLTENVRLRGQVFLVNVLGVLWVAGHVAWLVVAGDV